MMMMMMIRKSSAYLPYLGTYVIMESLLPPKKELRNMMCTHSLTHYPLFNFQAVERLYATLAP